MKKLTLYLYLSVVGKAFSILVGLAVAFSISNLLGGLAAGATAFSTLCAYLVDKEVYAQQADAESKMMQEYSKLIGGGSA